MTSGSLKDLSKALATFFPSADYPLPDDLTTTIQAYIDKRTSYDDAESQRLHEELLTLFHAEVKDKPQRYPAFIAVLRLLRANIRDAKRLAQWWDLLLLPLLGSHGQIKALVEESEGIILDGLIYDVDDDQSKETAEASSMLAERMVQLWLDLVSGTLAQRGFVTHYMEARVKPILLVFGRRRPQKFLTALNTFFVKKTHRAHILSLLGEFVRSGPPHLHTVLETPLFRNLLKCLSIDTSTTVVSLAISVLTMFLPHIPVSLSNYLPMVFNIYTRLLFWERQHAAAPKPVEMDFDDEKKKPDILEDQTDDDGSWEKLPFSSDFDEENIPELLQYFTFLYGLYPINFMSYIRKPQKYLRHANFPGAEDLDIEPTEIRARSEPFRQIHLLHPNFFHLTIESEITDANRWLKSDASDVVAECMALYSPILIENYRPFNANLTNNDRKQGANDDVPAQPLLDGDSKEVEKPASTETSASWRNTQSTAVGSIDGRALNETNQKDSVASRSVTSVADSPLVTARDSTMDSPTLPPQMMLSSPPHHLQDLLNSQRSLRSSLHQSVGGESVQSLPLNQSASESSVHVDAYLRSLAQTPQSPALRPSMDHPTSVAHLQREIMLLKNDLNFERYLKQQHIGHIGQLRRKQVKEATVEAETQNLINANKVLRGKLDDAKRSAIQLKKEFEKSRAVSRKWEADLGTKLRTIKEDLKKSKAECEYLQADLSIERQNVANLKQMVVKSEAKELESSQKIQSIEMDLTELNELKAELKKLEKIVKNKEALEKDLQEARAKEVAALSKAEVLQTKLSNCQADAERLRLDLGAEVASLKSKLDSAEESFRVHRQDKYQAMLDKALQSHRIKIAELQDAHARLVQKYTNLEAQLFEAEAERDPDTPLLSSSADQSAITVQSRFDQSPSSSRRRQRPHALSDPETFDVSSLQSQLSTSPSKSVPLGSDTPKMMTMANSQDRSTSTHSMTSPEQHRRHISLDGELSSQDASGADADMAMKPRIKPQSDIRVYGRGGVQNIGKKKGDKKDGDKKDKKSLGIRGIRGFV